MPGYDWTIPGKFGVYPSAGYVARMNATSAEELGEQFQEMWLEGWVDPQTRAVIVDFTVYNPGRQLMTVVKVLAEFTAMGKVIPSHSIRTFRYKPLVDLGDSSWWIDSSLLCMVLFYATAEAIDMAIWFHREAKRKALETLEIAKELTAITAGGLGSVSGINLLKDAGATNAAAAGAAGPAAVPPREAVHHPGGSYFDDPWSGFSSFFCDFQ